MTAEAERATGTGVSAFHQSVIDNLYDGVYYVDLHRRITYWNRGAERLTGYPAAEVVGRRCMDNLLMHVDDSGTVLCKTMCPLSATLADGRLREKGVFLKHRDGHRVAIDVRAAPIQDPDGRIVGAVEIFSDDSSRVESRHEIEELRSLAMSDPLTGMPNRRYVEMTLTSRIDDLARYGFPCGVLFVDIDHFKAVNDELGHSAGDGVLRAVAGTLRSAVRGADVVGRWGGEEFVVVLRAVDTQGLIEVAERVRVLVASGSVHIGRRHRRVTVSVGAALARPGETMESLVARADAAMYASKVAGRDRVTLVD